VYVISEIPQPFATVGHWRHNEAMTISPDGDRSGPVAPEVIAYYERSDEAARLDTSIGLVERERTRALLRRLLPPPPATVLDVGGGTGVHAVWLAQSGYHTHLSDPVAKHIDEARATADREGVSLASIRLGHAGDLAHADDSVDAVVALGPLYHLPQPDERARVLDEALRVLRPGGIVCAAAINRFTSMINAFREALLTDERFLEIVEGDLSTGRHRNDAEIPDFFTTAYVHRADELAEEVRGAGFVDVGVYAIEGLAWSHPELDECWHDERSRAAMLRLLERTEQESSLLGASTHLLGVGRRPA
jgi:ubiquinone/menaquinone biosynthesis C-methylase UbiE